MNFFHNDFYQKILICSSIAVMIGAVIANRISVPGNPKIIDSSDQQKDISKKNKSKHNPENILKIKRGAFLSENENYLNYSEEEDVVRDSTLLKKSKVFSKNHKMFLSDNEDCFKGKKTMTRRRDQDDKKLNQFYFALLNKLKE